MITLLKIHATDLEASWLINEISNSNLIEIGVQNKPITTQKRKIRYYGKFIIQDEKREILRTILPIK